MGHHAGDKAAGNNLHVVPCIARRGGRLPNGSNRNEPGKEKEQDERKSAAGIVEHEREYLARAFYSAEKSIFN